MGWQLRLLKQAYYVAAVVNTHEGIKVNKLGGAQVGWQGDPLRAFRVAQDLAGW
jgi:hypothetical protein